MADDIKFTKDITFAVRPACKEDFQAVRNMIQELANFEKMPNGPKITTEDLIKDGGFTGERDFFHCYIAEAVKCPTAERPLTRKTVGYAICFFSYSTWQGKSYFLEDIYVQPPYRNHGVGRLLLTEVIRKAKEYDCVRLDFHVLDWNPARKFYEHIGAINLTEAEGWHFYRLNQEEMDKILKNS